MSDDKVEKDFEPHDIDLGEMLGVKSLKGTKVTVTPESRIVQRDFVLTSVPTRLGPSHVEGAVEMPCILCGQGVWVSPSSQRLLAQAEDKGKVMCVECTVAATQAEKHS